MRVHPTIFEPIIAAPLMIQVFCDVTPCCWVNTSPCLEGSPSLHLQGHPVQEDLRVFDHEDEGIGLLRNVGTYSTCSESQWYTPEHLKLKADHCLKHKTTHCLHVLPNTHLFNASKRSLTVYSVYLTYH